MTLLRFRYSALALTVAACGANVEQDGSNSGPSKTGATGGVTSVEPTTSTGGSNSGLQGGMAVLTPDQWAQLNDSACFGWTPLEREGVSTDIPCAFAIPPTPAGVTIDPMRTNLIYSHGQPPSIRYLVGMSDGDCAAGDGWFLDPTNQIVLCPKTCAIVQQDPTESIDVRAGCGGPIIID